MKLIGISMVLSLILISSISYAAESSYSGRLTTVLERYKTVDDETAMPFYQYVRLSMNNYLNVGDSNYFYLYGRLSDDLNNNDFAKSRLYSAFFNVDGLAYGLDGRFGRQYIYTVAGSAVTDGVEIRKVFSDWIEARVFGGGEASFIEDTEEGDWLYGFSLNFINMKGANLGLSYFNSEDAWNTARRAIGLDASYRVRELAKLNGEARYDLISESLSYYSIGGKGYIGDKTTISLDYSYNLPVFDATDVYSVFAVEERSDLNLGIDFRLNDEITIFGSIGREFYEETDDTNVIELGANMRKPGRYTLYASMMAISGEEDLTGGKLSGRYIFTDRLEAGGGIEYDTYQNEDMSGSERASMYYLDAKYSLSDAMGCSVRLEKLDSEARDSDVRILARFTYDFRSR